MFYLFTFTYNEEGTAGRAAAPPSLLLTVLNVTTDSSSASVPTSYYSMWHLCSLKGQQAWVQDQGHGYKTKAAKLGLNAKALTSLPGCDVYQGPFQSEHSSKLTLYNAKAIIASRRTIWSWYTGRWCLMSVYGLRLIQRGWAWAGPQPGQAPPRCTKCNSPPINSQCTNHRIAV